MIAMILCGALLGAALFALLLRLVPPRPSPVVQLGRFDARLRQHGPDLPDERVAGATGWSARVGAWVASELARRGYQQSSLRQDLALSGDSLGAAMGRKVVGFVSGFLLALLAMVAVQLTVGLSLPLGSPLVLAFGVGAAFFFLPDLEARSSATARRRDFRRALGAYLDLVSLEMAGSAAPAEALPSAASVGAGWPLALIRHTLYRAVRAGEDQWAALSELGARIGVDELRDLGSTIQLVARDGAGVRKTLIDRAATMRRKELSDAEGQAGQRDQSMRMAQILIGFGFIVFIGYPAIANVMQF